MAKLALGAQFAALLALAVIVATPESTGPGTEYQVVSGTEAATPADLTIAFAPQTSESAVREMLIGLDAQIVGGPNSLGMYDIALPEGADLSAIQQQLQAHELTTYVQPAAQP